MIKAVRAIRHETDSNVFPLVAPKKAHDRSIWIIGAVLAVAGVLLFVALDGRRRALTAPATTRPAEASSGAITAPPNLFIPGEPYRTEDGADRGPAFQVRALTERGAPLLRPPLRTTPERPAPARQPQGYRPPSEVYVPEQQGVTGEYELPPTYSPGGPQEQPQTTPKMSQPADALKDRAFAIRLANPATTVPLGTVIPAVLETALDSTRAGAVRAIVSRDVRGFDGSRTLVARGSRLYGEYSAELAPGQGRALIRWIRLIRPDGVMIALDSPASDPLGRAGVEGVVDSKFLERFGEALLQSTLNVGAGVASRGLAGSPVIYALPTSAPAPPGSGRQQVQRTLKVRQGTSVSVFVARDLDFTAVEN